MREEYHFTILDANSAVAVLVERFDANDQPEGWSIYLKSFNPTPARRIRGCGGAFPWERNGLGWDPCYSKEHAECLLHRRLP